MRRGALVSGRFAPVSSVTCRAYRLVRLLALPAALAWGGAACARATPPVPLTAADSVAHREAIVRARVDSAIRAFQLEWRHLWQDTQLERQRPVRNPAHRTVREQERVRRLHCHWDVPGPNIAQHLIGGRGSHANCPSWYPDNAPPVEDERRGIDLGLNAAARWRLAPLRQRLRLLLDDAAADLPRDVTLARQRVRFAIDAGDLQAAATIAAECAAGAVDCGLLRAFVLYHAGLPAAADSAFLAALGGMEAAERCRWTDVAPLLERELRDEYDAMPCAGRAAFDEAFWMLADPLYVEPGNERRAEHFARRMTVAVRAPLGQDERQHWATRRGGDAVAEGLVRYGWPSHVFWYGHFEDTEHDGWLRFRNADTARPYVVREYSRGRLHTVPLPRALRAPLEARADDWALNGPRDQYHWWPVEHFARDAGGIVQLPQGQRVQLRRWDATRYVWALDLDAEALGRRSGDTVAATLFEARAPGEVAAVGAFIGSIGVPLVLDAPFAEGRALVALELPGDSSRPAARTRFGVAIEPGLRALGEARALSGVMFFAPLEDSRALLGADAAARRMYGTTTLARPRRVGIYWEAYGFAASDTVDIELRVSREERPGVLERVGGLLRLGREDGGDVGVRWREAPAANRAIVFREGSVPVEARSTVLEMSRLPRGRYRIEVVMARAGEAAVSRVTEFAIE